MREWFAAGEIAAMELPGLSKFESNLIKRTKKENWVSRSRTGRGGGLEYHIENLPRSAREELVRRHLSSGETAIVPAQAPLLPAETLHFAVWQRETMQARLAVLAELERIVLHHSLTKNAPQPTTAELWAQVRAERDGLLAQSDWTQMPDSPLTAAKKTAWAVYRQSLRDITTQADPAAVAWPVAPDKKGKTS